MAPRFDVCVVGAGPAGAATARQLARSGLDVALLSHPARTPRSIGETVGPAMRVLLGELGLPSELEAQGHRPAYARRAVWGSDTVEERSSIFDLGGHGFHLDRARFDAWLRDEAQAAGAHLLAVKARRIERDALGRVRALWVEAGAAQQRLEARYFVDASGRAGWLGRRLGAERWVAQELVAVASFHRRRGVDDVMLVHGAPNGWWYTAALPSQEQVAMWVGSPQHAPRNADAWSLSLGQARRVEALLGEALGPPLTRPCGPTLFEWDSRDSWLPVGDAAAAFDPISGQGLCFALRSALEAAWAIRSALHAETGALSAYKEGVRQVFELHLRQRARAYCMEPRFAEHPFWRAAQRVAFSRSNRDG